MGKAISKALVFFLGLAVPGIGHVYAGNLRRGFVILALRFLVLYPLQIAFLAAATTPFMAVLSRVIGIPVNALLAVDGVLAVRSFPRRRFDPSIRWVMTIISGAVGVGLVILAITLARHFWVSVSRIPTGAMRPTLEVGDEVSIDRRRGPLGQLRVGDVIVFQYPPEPEVEYIKRIAGLPGQTLEVIDGCLVLGGRKTCRRTEQGWTEEAGGKPYGIRLREGAPASTFGPIQVPEDALFMLGDNRMESADSRQWGFVPMEMVTGRMRHVSWSTPISFKPGEERKREWTQVRWERIGAHAFVE